MEMRSRMCDDFLRDTKPSNNMIEYEKHQWISQGI